MCVTRLDVPKSSNREILDFLDVTTHYFIKVARTTMSLG
jgi:hypothetical protein